MKNITQENIQFLWKVIDYAAKNQLSLEAIVNNQQILNNNKFVSDFFNDLAVEIGLNEYNINFSKYLNYIETIKTMFSDRFEFGGGKQFRFYHSIYVANLANKIAVNLKLTEEEREIVILSALFHDIGKSIDAFKYVDERGFDKYEILYNTGRHEDIGVKITKNLLLGNNIDENIIKIILESISYNNSGSLYENILHEADNIAEIGLMGIWRFFYFKSCENKELSGLNKFWFNKIRKIKLEDLNNCRFDISRNIMQSNIEIVDWFLDKII